MMHGPMNVKFSRLCVYVCVCVCMYVRGRERGGGRGRGERERERERIKCYQSLIYFLMDKLNFCRVHGMRK